MRQRFRPLFPVVASLVVLAASAGAAHATTANDLCLPAANPCVVTTGTHAVTNDSILDFGTRAVEVVGTIDVQPAAVNPMSGGRVTILAGSLTVKSSGRIYARSTTTLGGVILVTTTGAIDVQSGSGSSGIIDASGTGGGAVSLTAGGTATINGPISANGTTDDGGRGQIDIKGTTVLIDLKGDLSATSGRFDAGGAITITATTGAATVNGKILATGGTFDGGDVNISAAGNVTCTDTIDVNGTLDPTGGDAGSVDITSGGNVSLSGPILGRASLGGRGAQITILAPNGSVSIAGAISATGGDPDGTGGTFDVTAGTTFAQANTDALIDLSAAGTSSWGGDFGVVAGGAVTIRNVNVSAGYDGGDVSVATDGLLTLIGPIAADGLSTITTAGSIQVNSTAGVQASGRIHADATPGQPGGYVSVQGCSITVASTAQLSANGVSGSNEIVSSTSIISTGAYSAGAMNRFRYRLPGTPPSVGGSLVPAATLLLDPTIAACGIATTTTTTSTTTTTTTSAPGSTTTTTAAATTTTSSTVVTTTSTTTTTTTSTTTTTTTLPTTTLPTTTSTQATTSTTVTTTTSTTSTVVPTSSTTTSTTLPTLCGDGSPAACNDADRCTLDQCVTGICVHTQLADFPAISCRLDGMTAELTAEAGRGIPSAGLAARLTSRVLRARNGLDKAELVEGLKRRLRLRRIIRLATRTVLTIDRLVERGRIDPAVGAILDQLGNEAIGRLTPLASSL